MAIFSQSNEKTKVDFRNYDRNLPNRCVPYKLKNSIIQSILDFSIQSGYDTGSIDILYGCDSKYYFLEINHSGNYEWLAENCNYPIDKEIAQHIFEKHNNYNI